MIASNGVNGSAAAEGHPASGIQGDFALTLFEVRGEQWGEQLESSSVLAAADLGVHPSSGCTLPPHHFPASRPHHPLHPRQDGLLPAAFMIGLLASSPIFAEASKHHNAFRLIGIGLAVWTVAAAGCGLAPGFGTLLVCRAAVGVGEASFVALAAPFIGEAPPLATSVPLAGTLRRCWFGCGRWPAALLFRFPPALCNRSQCLLLPAGPPP